MKEVVSSERVYVDSLTLVQEVRCSLWCDVRRARGTSVRLVGPV